MKNIKHIILAFTYIPGAAHVNRIIGYRKGYEACGLKVTLAVYCLRRFSDPDFLKEDDLFVKEPNIPFLITRRFCANYRIRKAIKKVYNSNESVVHIYGTPIWASLLNFKKMDVFFEKTEIPFYAESKSLVYLYQEYIGQKLTLMGRGLICISNGLKEYFSQYGVHCIEVANMFVDESRFAGIRPHIEQRPYIFYCGNISSHKDGADILIKAFKILHDRYPKYKLKMVGGFERLYNEELKLRKLVEDLHIEDSVEFTGRIPASEIPALMMGASILALARPLNKQATYGFPTKVGEYICAKRPIVLTNVGEIGLFLRDGENCLIACPNDIEDFAEKMIWTIINEKEADLIACNAYRLVKNEFSAQVQSKICLSFFNSTLNDTE